MSRRRTGKITAGTSYTQDLHAAMRQFLPHSGLPLLSPHNKKIRWTPRLLVMTAVMMAWSPAATLIDRFLEARNAVVKMFCSRRRPGKTYEGFAAALERISDALLEQLAGHWRECVQKVAGEHWRIGKWIVFGSDGSKIDEPRTAANEEAFGTSGKNNSGPQQLITSLFHVGIGALWAWRRSGLRGSSERQHLRQMLHLLPADALLLADAGFTGYDLLQSIMEGGRHFLMRVGANVRLLRKLGYYLEEHEGIVYLWPDARQGRDSRRRLPRKLKKVDPPLVLRLIELADGRGRKMALLTSVLDPTELSEAMAARLYALRWGIELMWRNLKQTMGRDKMRSGSPKNSARELDWAMAGLWMLQLLAVSRMRQSGQSPQRYSTAGVLRVLREAMGGRLGRGQGLARKLAAAVKDTYHRHGDKKARHYPRKKRERPPGLPLARKATQTEIRLAQQLRAALLPESLAA